MLKYFINNKQQPQFLVLSILVIVVGILFTLNEFSVHTSPSDGILYSSIIFFVSINPLLGRIIFFFFLLGSGMLFNQLFTSYQVLPRRNYSILLFWLILLLAFPMMWNINPQLIAFVIVIYAFFQLFSASKENLKIRDLINISLLFSLASLIYKPFLGYIIFLPIALMLLRQFNLKFFFIILIIYSIPYLYLWVYFLFMDKPLEILHLFNFYVFHPSLNINILKDYHFSVSLVFGGLLFIFSLGNIVGKMAKRLIHIRLILSLIIAYFLITFLLISISPVDSGYNIFLLLAPVAALISIGVIEVKTTWILDMYLVVFIFSSLLLYFL